MDFDIVSEDDFRYVEQGEGKVLLLLHGLFGALSNFSDLIQHFSKSYRVIIPMLPLYEMPVKQSSVGELKNFLQQFVEFKQLTDLILIGNSLGGHIALLYSIEFPEKVSAMVLTGSSGLFENSLGDTFPTRGNYDYVKTKTEATFYDSKMATKDLVDEVFATVNDREKVLRIIYIARSAIRQNVGEYLKDLHTPTLLIWGKDDIITPAFVGKDFDDKLPNSELHYIEKCGHAPMMEHPQTFNQLTEQFLNKLFEK